MDLLIRNILDYSRTAQQAMSRVRIPMATLLNDLQQEILAQSPSDKTKIEIQETPDITGDVAMVRQVFYNLLGNAVKYSSKSDNPAVSVGGQVNALGVTYCIMDNGIGIAEKDASHVFTLFQRLGNSTNFPGTGVGLAIVKRIMDRHGGKVWLDSTVGIRTSFYVFFPFSDREVENKLK